MRAIVREKYGTADVLELRDVDTPVMTDDDVLVRVRAASVNPYDWHVVTGVPYIARLVTGLRRPKSHLLGADFAGIVEAAGSNVRHLRPGDEVFGAGTGSFAEQLCVRADRAVAPKPENLTFAQAAAVPLAAITALQALRNKGRIQAGQKVLINGASGGVGTFAVQLAKAFGAEVTAVCSTRNVDAIRSIGADHVIDYTQEDFTRTGRRHDLMLDIAGNRSWSECKRVLADGATLVIVGGPKTNRWIGSLGVAVRRRIAAVIGTRTVVWFVATMNAEDLAVLRDLLETARMTPVVERQCELSETPEALRYVGQGHAQGKIVITT